MTIDYFEFTVLVEASWHSGTILRHSIMEKAINVWYKELTWKERKAAYEFFNRTQKATNEIQERFLARFNTDNQFRVHSKGKGIERTDIYTCIKAHIGILPVHLPMKNTSKMLKNLTHH